MWFRSILGRNSEDPFYYMIEEQKPWRKYIIISNHSVWMEAASLSRCIIILITNSSHHHYLMDVNVTYIPACSPLKFCSSFLPAIESHCLYACISSTFTTNDAKWNRKPLTWFQQRHICSLATNQIRSAEQWANKYQRSAPHCVGIEYICFVRAVMDEFCHHYSVIVMGMITRTGNMQIAIRWKCL